MSDYRTRIYEQYASVQGAAQLDFDARNANRWGRAYDYYLRGFLPQNKHAAIADLACGAGRLLHFFKERGYENLAGTDISPEQVAIARQVVANVAHDDVCEYLAGHPSAFDLITGLDIIEHLDKNEVLRFLDGCCGSLKPGGRLILQTPNANSAMACCVRYADFTHEVCFTPDLLMRLMTMHGFRQITVREMGPIPWGYSLISSLRFVVWKALCQVYRVLDLVEKGSIGAAVYTRVFLISGVRAGA
jgi:SAM-dependent methyltransferase